MEWISKQKLGTREIGRRLGPRPHRRDAYATMLFQLEAGIGNGVFFELDADFFGERGPDFGEDFKDGVRGNAIILFGKQFLFKGKMGHLLKEIFDIRGSKARVSLMIRFRSISPVLSLER